MKLIILAFIVWQGGAESVIPIGTESACVELTARLAPYVESANCESFSDYSAARDVIPPKP